MSTETTTYTENIGNTIKFSPTKFFCVFITFNHSLSPMRDKNLFNPIIKESGENLYI